MATPYSWTDEPNPYVDSPSAQVYPDSWTEETTTSATYAIGATEPAEVSFPVVDEESIEVEFPVA